MFPTEIFRLRVTWRIGLKIAQRAGEIVEIQYLDRMSGHSPDEEDRNFGNG